VDLGDANLAEVHERPIPTFNGEPFA
jgi:hypothetical protein